MKINTEKICLKATLAGHVLLRDDKDIHIKSGITPMCRRHRGKFAQCLTAIKIPFSAF